MGALRGSDYGKLYPIAFLMCGILAAPAAALTPQEKGYEIAARNDGSDDGFGDSVVDVQMILRNPAGEEDTRSLTIRTLEVLEQDRGDESFIIFDSPPDVKGTALLSHMKILEPDDQWLYIPALRRTKRISSVNKSGPFVGSEFAFEDFTAQELGKYAYQYVGEQPCGNLTCDVIERHPQYEHSGYTKQLAWIDQNHYQVRKVEFFDRRGELLKSLTLDNYENYEGSYWRPKLMSMVNHQTGKSTDLVFSTYKFHTGLKDNDFVKDALERVR